ncbi:MAG TPA: hypothetical protein VMI75_23430 [Polyangiaceae bacterium]|nr:hypothetical protein [Polyangiaceae bacterium]
MRSKGTVLVIVCAAAGGMACGISPEGLLVLGKATGGAPGSTDDGGAASSSSSSGGNAGGSSGGAVDAGTATDASTHPPPGDGGGKQDAGSSSGGGGGDVSPACYSEPYDPTAGVSDVAAAFTGDNWLTSALTVMQRRYPTGYFVLDAEQNDPQLPQFVDASSWSALMGSMMTMLEVETGGWDFNNASATVHPFVILNSMQISAPVMTTWQQGEILQYITDDSTQTWDQAELQGQEGTYDGIFLFDDLDSACEGLAAATAVGDQLTYAVPARDDVAAHLYYMELYLKDGRLSHASEYATIKADANWQKLVRYEWARGHFWDAQGTPNANLQLAVAPIWTHIDDPANLQEIQLFTGESPDAVACHP